MNPADAEHQYGVLFLSSFYDIKIILNNAELCVLCVCVCIHMLVQNRNFMQKVCFEGILYLKWCLFSGLPCLSEVMHQALNAKNERVLLEVIEKYSFEDIQKCFEQEPTLFHRICAQGFHTLATFFLEAAHIDPTIKHEGVRKHSQLLLSCIYDAYNLLRRFSAGSIKWLPWQFKVWVSV